MITYDAIEEKIFDFLVLATGLDEDQIRRSYQNASAQPTQDRAALCSFNIINQVSIGIDSAHYVDEQAGTDLDETVYGDRNMTVSIKTYSDEDSNTQAQDITEQISLWLRSSAATEYFNINGLGFLRRGQVLDISSIQNGSFEGRRSLDVEFHIVMDNTATVNAIESSEIGLNYYGSDTITATIEVTE